MKDFLGQDVSVGDRVIYTAYDGTGLRIGVVEKVNPKTVDITSDRRLGRKTRKGPEYVVKIQEVTSE